MDKKSNLKEVVSSAGAPKAIGPYSQAVRVGNLVFTAGQAGLDPASGTLVGGGIVEQTRRVLENLKAVLSAAGLTFSHVVKTNVYLASMSDFAAMNEVYASYFPEPFPARTTIQAAGLPKQALVEIDLVAVVPAE